MRRSATLADFSGSNTRTGTSQETPLRPVAAFLAASALAAAALTVFCSCCLLILPYSAAATATAITAIEGGATVARECWRQSILIHTIDEQCAAVAIGASLDLLDVN